MIPQLSDSHVEVEYWPQPKQQMMHSCPANEILYGGAAGPGKSHAIRHEALLWAVEIPKLQVYLFRRTYPELEKNHILPILMDWGETYGKYNEQKRRYLLPNKAAINMCHAQHERDVMLYHGAEIHLLIIDELTTFSEWQYTYLRNRVRCTLDLPPEYKHKIPGCVSGSNPGGVGHEFAKRCFVDYCRLPSQEAEARKADTTQAMGPVYEHPSKRLGYTVHYGLRQATDNEGGMVRAYIPGLLEDNPILMKRDPGYIKRVMAMPEPYRSAYLDGDWEIFVGQMFNFSRPHHVCAPHALPKHAPVYFSFDWGFGKPFSCGWTYVDADGRCFRFAEWYGWNRIPDQGLRLTDSEIAEGIIKMEKSLGLRSADGGKFIGDVWTGRQLRPIDYVLSPDCFSKKPDYKGGGQGASTAEVFGDYDIVGYPGDATRDQKVRQYHERLRVKEGEVPMYQIFDICTQYLRTVPLLQQDEHNPEDVDTKSEDHIYDESALVFMARPLSLEIPAGKKSSIDRRIDELIEGNRDEYEDRATIQTELEMQRLEGDEWDHLDDGEEYDDGNMGSTIDSG